MSITIFDPKSIKVGPIGPMLAEKVSIDGLKDFFEAKSNEEGDGNLSSIVVGESEKMGVGVGTWGPGQCTKEPIPVIYDEALVIVEGSLQITIDGKTHHADQGHCVHIPAGSLVDFGSEEGCRLLWIASPPTWTAFEQAWKSGALSP